MKLTNKKKNIFDHHSMQRFTIQGSKGFPLVIKFPKFPGLLYFSCMQ